MFPREHVLFVCLQIGVTSIVMMKLQSEERLGAIPVLPELSWLLRCLENDVWILPDDLP